MTQTQQVIQKVVNTLDAAMRDLATVNEADVPEVVSTLSEFRTHLNKQQIAIDIGRRLAISYIQKRLNLTEGGK